MSAVARRRGGGVALAADEQWLEVDLGAEHRAASWAIVGGGLGRARTVIWHRVTDADVPPGRDPQVLLRERLGARGHTEAIGMLTGRRLDRYADVAVATDAATARCIATAGLSNAVCVGDPPSRGAVGTINLLCRVSVPLSDEGLLEAMSIATEARTAAVTQLGVPSTASDRVATGTGTDCIVVASPLPVGASRRYAGKHTAVGHVVGAATRRAVSEACAAWLAEQGARGG